MKLSFRDIVASDAYDQQASAQSKANITVASLVQLYILIFEPWGFGWLWVLVVPVSWFLVSVCVAMPFMMAKAYFAAKLSESVTAARVTSAVVDVMNYVVLVPLVYVGLRYLSAFVGG